MENCLLYHLPGGEVHGMALLRRVQTGRWAGVNNNNDTERNGVRQVMCNMVLLPGQS